MPALRLVEARQPPGPDGPPPAALRVAAWNLERCTAVEASAALLRRVGAEVALLSEMDLGMARSDNRHTTRDLAAALGAGHAFGVEFVELGHGLGRELERFAGQANRGPLHGNALVSRRPFRDAVVVPLDDGGAWFDLDWHHRRIGGRMAIGATVDLASGPVLVVSLHLENRSTPDERRRAVERLLAALPPGAPAVLAGDLNVAALPKGAERAASDWFARPDAHEPLFAAMRDAGFDWLRCNTPDQTRRAIPDGRPAPWVQRIDWFFTRGVAASNPRTWAAVGEDGAALSDHELITVDIG
ncbi:endonuclease/exonuclease/phosphatase family protein [Lichenibacterium ramalinae]|nr:endonuclease/exonuclease/phosphatase family protein [Lichenibacterium ramalinae]